MRTLKFYLEFMLIAILTMSSLTSNAQLPSGLKLYLPFSGTINDASGQNHVGTLFNATLTTDRFGNPNSAYFFNGTNARIEFPDHPDFRPASFTIAAWVNISSGNQSIISKSFGGSFFNSYTIGYNSNSLASALSDGSISAVYFSNTVKPSGWFHYAITFDDAANIEKFYINGNLVATIPTFSNPLGYDGNLLTIGGEYENGGLAYMTSGSVDEVMIFNRALLPGEVMSITIPVSNVPTLSQWGMIALGVIVVGTGMFFARRIV